MQETFEIPVTYKNEELLFKAYVTRYGYIQHIVVDINNTKVIIERDEEGNYRALVDEEKLRDSKVNLELVKAVIDVLAAL